MVYLNLFVAFLVPGLLGYGGGPASIPLIQHEVVENHEWMTTSEFSEVLAIGNSLPGPIATKMAGYIGFEVGGFFGVFIAMFATIAPSLLLMILLVGILLKYRDSPKVKRLTIYIRPVIIVLLASLTFQFLNSSVNGIGSWSSGILLVLSYILLEKFKVHPALVIFSSIVYGAVFLGG
ncbi:chromate transporter [Salibacterium aidingense]|uniref:chromate transporter n=1 Tax=Salibacterium aidingense TaxID=384933 RepID=UPI0003FBEB3A|nr:chromate transporter [Salibacterium aidingense]